MRMPRIFSRMIWPQFSSPARFEQSAKNIRQKKDTSRFAPAPLRRRLHEFYFGGGLRSAPVRPKQSSPGRLGPVCRSSSRKQNRPRSIVQDASKRSNGLSRKRVPSSGEYSCLIVPTLPNSNHQKRQNHTAKILATE